MAKQVNFYMLDRDEADFAAFVLSQPGTVIVAARSLSEVPTALDQLPSRDEGVIWRNKVFLWRGGEPIYTRLVLFRGGPLKGMQAYSVDFSNSYVIEFSRSVLLDDGVLVRGRIWAEMYSLQAEQLVYKGEPFEKWYDSIAAWIRRHFTKIGSRPFYYYIGPQAYAWYEAGGKLSPAP